MARVIPNKVDNVLNKDRRTLFDERNDEAKKHEGHELLVLRRRHVEHLMTEGYDEHDVICQTCRKQFKARVWRTVCDRQAE